MCNVRHTRPRLSLLLACQEHGSRVDLAERRDRKAHAAAQVEGRVLPPPELSYGNRKLRPADAGTQARRITPWMPARRGCIRPLPPASVAARCTRRAALHAEGGAESTGSGMAAGEASCVTGRLRRVERCQGMGFPTLTSYTHMGVRLRRGGAGGRLEPGAPAVPQPGDAAVVRAGVVRGRALRQHRRRGVPGGGRRAALPALQALAALSPCPAAMPGTPVHGTRRALQP